MFLNSIPILSAFLLSLLLQRDVDEADDPSLHLVLRSFDDHNKLLSSLRSKLINKVLRQLLVGRILDEPAVVLFLGILDETAILVREWQLFPVVLPEDRVTVKGGFLRDGQVDLLLLHGQVGELESGAQDFATNELAIVDDVRVQVKHRVDVNFWFFGGLQDRLNLLLARLGVSEQALWLVVHFRFWLLDLRVIPDNLVGRSGISGLDINLVGSRLLLEFPHPLDWRLGQSLATGASLIWRAVLFLFSQVLGV